MTVDSCWCMVARIWCKCRAAMAKFTWTIRFPAGRHTCIRASLFVPLRLCRIIAVEETLVSRDSSHKHTRKPRARMAGFKQVPARLTCPRGTGRHEGDKTVKQMQGRLQCNFCEGAAPTFHNRMPALCEKLWAWLKLCRCSDALCRRRDGTG